MKIGTTLLLGTLAALGSATAMAVDAPGAACTLLTQADLDAATGSKSGAANPMDQDLPTGSGKQVTMYSCLWPVSGVQGQVLVGIGPAPPGQSAKSLSLNNAGMDAMRAQHYTQDTKDFGNTTCFTMTPAASVKEGMHMSACGTIAHSKFVSVTFMSPTKKLPIEQTRVLLDKAVARLH
jgi:hypothetical protein